MIINGERALIVEDERSWQQILKEILTDSGMVVKVAATLEEALSLVRTQSFRLAIVDLSLESDDPNSQDGLRVLEALGEHDPDCIKVLLTGFATVELAVSVLTDYGAFTCLRKEAFNRSQFRRMIGQVMDAREQKDVLDKKDERPEETAAAGDNNQAVTGSALVVEDDEGWRGILSELLQDNGYQVCLCTGFGEALGHLLRDTYQLAVVDLSLTGDKINLSDWSQPASAEDLEGYRLLTSTRARGVPTIVVSGMSNPYEIEKAYQEQGIFAYLEKQSFDRRNFLATVEEARASTRTHRKLDLLTEREREVLDLLAQGMTNKEIAENLFVSTNTVKRHLKSIFGKLDIHTRSAAAAKAMEAGGGKSE